MSKPGDDDYPVIVEQEGIKLKTEKMETEKLYYCIYDGKAFLFYKDEAGLLNCYEVEDPSAVKEISEDPSNLEAILKRHAEAADQ